jgi:tetratricopeptide (TPR) repeat protein
MKKIIFILFLVIPLYLNAAIKVPTFSFIGKEISKFEINSSFSNINVKFNGNTKFDTYLTNATLEFKDVDKTEYKAKDPGFMYSGEFGTGLSAVFVGEKAYKNYILKEYLSKNYISVLSAYKEYIKKLKKEKYITEVKFLYALSLLETGGYQEAEEILKEIALSDNDFSEYAIDRLMTYYFKSGNYTKLIDFSKQIEVLTPHPLYLTLYTYAKQKNYEEISKLIKKYESYKRNNTFIYDFEIISNYYMGNFDKVSELSEHYNESTKFFIIDSLLMVNQKNKANELINKLKDEQMKAYFMVKSSILDGETEMATYYISKVEDETDKLNLYFFYITHAFPHLDVKFINSFQLSPINMDYINFYKGIYFLEEKQYIKAAHTLEKVNFKPELLITSYFYKAIAYTNFNPKKSIYYFLKYISLGNDEEKITISRFMIAQFKYLDKKYNEAMAVLSGCSKPYCKELKAEIYIKQRKFKTALSTLKNLKTDKALYLKAVCYFNQKDLKKSKALLLKIKKPNPDSDLLLMTIYYKNSNFKKANLIFEKYHNDEKFINAAIKHLFLKGKFNEVLTILNNSEPLTDQQKLIKAKALFSIGKHKEAELIFKDFINRKIFLYDSIYGLISINQASNKKGDFVKSSLNLIEKYDFDKKDFLIVQLAKLALEKNEINTGIKLINTFFKKYKKSPYTTDAYIVKAGLFMKLKRYDECVSDMNSVLKKYKNNEDALFQKAECLEYIDKDKALDTYKILSQKSKRFKSVAYIKIIQLSDDKKELLKAADYFKNVDTLKYLEASEKFLNKISDRNEILKYDEMVYNLLDSNNEKFVPAGLYYTAIINLQTNNYKQSARYALKGYYLFKKSKYSKSYLEIAKEAYINLKDEESAKKIDKLLKKKN